MIRLLAIRKNVDLETREKFALSPKRLEEGFRDLNEIFDEVVILNTCNRTEIYFNSFCDKEDEEILKKIFGALKWDYSLAENCIILKEDGTIKHLMNVSCGFHSKIFGEDQILGQIKNAYAKALELNTMKNTLGKLFEVAISCGKEFRAKSKLYEIPVSSASIVVAEAIKNNSKKFMVIGYGDVGRLVSKYILANDFDSLIIGVRDINKVNDIDDNRVVVMRYEEARKCLENVDCLITCTSAPHLMIERVHINERKKPLVIFDLSVPRDVEDSIKDIENIELYDIDRVSLIDDKNKETRKNIMISNKYIIYKSIERFNEWKKQRKISPYIKEMKEERDKVILDRINSFSHKCKSEEDINLANTLIKSATDVYINRAIEVLKEETLNGSEEECLRILKKVFIERN